MLNMEICSLGQEISSTHKTMDWVTHHVISYGPYDMGVLKDPFKSALGHPYNGGEE